VTGLLSSDKSIEGATFSFDHFAKAIGHASDGLIAIFGTIAKAEGVLAHFASGTALLLNKDYQAAAAEYATAMKDLTPGSGAVLGTIAGTAAGPVLGGALGKAFGGPAGSIAGTAAGAMLGPFLGAGAGAA
jgi:hypothetical protein